MQGDDSCTEVGSADTRALDDTTLYLWSGSTGVFVLDSEEDGLALALPEVKLTLGDLELECHDTNSKLELYIVRGYPLVHSTKVECPLRAGVPCGRFRP